MSKGRFNPPQEGDKYQTKPWNYQYDDRYFRMSDQQYQQQQEQQRMHEREQQLQMEERQRRDHQLPGPQYGPSSFRSDERLHYDENKGYLVLIRLRRSDLGELISAIQKCTSTLSSDHGYVIGFSDNMGDLWKGQKMMEVLVSNYQPHSGQQWWSPHDSKSSQFGVCCLWFKDFTSAKGWFESAPIIKSKDFPNHNPFQSIAVPLTFGGNNEPLPFSPAMEEITLLWCEFPKIYERYQDDFLQNYSEPARRRIKYHFGTPNVSVSKYKPYWPEEPNRFGQSSYNPMVNQHERVGRPVRNAWIEPETFVTVTTFPTMQHLKNFFYDEEYQDSLRRLHAYSAPVFVAMTLKSIRGTRQR